MKFLLRRLSNRFFVFILIVGAAGWSPAAYAQLSSDNFRMTSDSLNCGGGRTSSTSFSIIGTLCEPAVGTNTFPTNTNFNLEQGFPAMDDVPFLSVSLLNSAGTAAKTSLSFGTLTQGSVANDTILVRVTTNAANGYAAAVASDGALRSSNDEIVGVSDGTVDGSSSHGEYGFSVSSSDTTNCSRPTGDRSISTSGTTFATCTIWKNQSDNTLTFKAAAGASNASGSFGQALSVIVTSTF
jgi:hypothetical protein